VNKRQTKKKNKKIQKIADAIFNHLKKTDSYNCIMQECYYDLFVRGESRQITEADVLEIHKEMNESKDSATT
jgi:hypothetical protein